METSSSRKTSISRGTANVQKKKTDWRNEKRTASERFLHLLDTGEGADIYFMVGKTGEVQELIAAHKSFLLAGSSVFEAQFRHGTSSLLSQLGTEEQPIEISDVRPEAFWALLKYLYSDDFGGVTKQNVMDVYGVAKKYMMDGLVDRCRQSLIDGQNLDMNNVCSVLKHAQQYEDQELIDYCWTFIDSNTNAVLESEGFLALESTDLCELFNRGTLQSTELFLFQNLNRWAIHKCEAAIHVEPTPENKRAAIGEAIEQIRFPLITQRDFTKHIVPTGLLSEKDIIAVYVHHNSVGGCGSNGEEAEEASSLYPNRFNGLYRTGRGKLKGRRRHRVTMNLALSPSP